MNYLVLKNVISWILANFSCPQCKSPATESWLDIHFMNNNSLDIHFFCKNCQTKSLIKAELGQFSPNSFFANDIKDFSKKSIKSVQLFPREPNARNSSPISPDEIKEIEKKLTQTPSINDLFNGE